MIYFNFNLLILSILISQSALDLGEKDRVQIIKITGNGSFSDLANCSARD